MVNKWRALNDRKKDPRTVSRRRKKNKTPVASTEAESINDMAGKNTPLPSTTPTTPLPSVIPSTSLSPLSTSIDSHDQEVSTIAQEETASARKIKAAAAHKVRDDDVDNSCYILMDTGIMSSIFSELITCPRCQWE